MQKPGKGEKRGRKEKRVLCWVSQNCGKKKNRDRKRERLKMVADKLKLYRLSLIHISEPTRLLSMGDAGGRV
mgnify:CR=1 FL=1